MKVLGVNFFLKHSVYAALSHLYLLKTEPDLGFPASLHNLHEAMDFSFNSDN